MYELERSLNLVNKIPPTPPCPDGCWPAVWGMSVEAVAVFPDGKRVVSGSYNGTVKIWDADSGAELCTMSGHRRGVTAVAVFADGTRVVSGSLDRTVKIWKMIIKYVPTKRVYNLLLTALNEDVVEIIRKYAVATKGELAQFNT